MNLRDRPPRTQPLADRSKTKPLTSPLKEGPIFRPAPYLAVVAILLPIGSAIIASMVLLDTNQRVPIWVPLLILLCIPLLTVAWLFMQTVRVTQVGVAVGKPLQRWHEVMWNEIVRVERHGMFIRIRTKHGDTLTFAPRLLLDGNRLLDILFAYLLPPLLDGALRAEALDRRQLPETDLTEILRVRPRNRWPMLGFLLAVVGIVGATTAHVLLGPPLSWALSAVGVLLALLGIAIAIWLLQEVIVTSEGLTILRPWRRAADELLWTEIRTVHHTKNWALLQFRGMRSVRCIGPALLRKPERIRMHAYIDHYCLRHGNGAVPIAHTILL